MGVAPACCCAGDGSTGAAAANRTHSTRHVVAQATSRGEPSKSIHTIFRAMCSECAEELAFYFALIHEASGNAMMSRLAHLDTPFDLSQEKKTHECGCTRVPYIM